METGLVRKSADNGAVSAELPKGEVRVSVRNLVEFILRGGDIDNSTAVALEKFGYNRP